MIRPSTQSDTPHRGRAVARAGARSHPPEHLDHDCRVAKGTNLPQQDVAPPGQAQLDPTAGADRCVGNPPSVPAVNARRRRSTPRADALLPGSVRDGQSPISHPFDPCETTILRQRHPENSRLHRLHDHDDAITPSDDTPGPARSRNVARSPLEPKSSDLGHLRRVCGVDTEGVTGSPAARRARMRGNSASAFRWAIRPSSSVSNPPCTASASVLPALDHWA